MNGGRISGSVPRLRNSVFAGMRVRARNQAMGMPSRHQKNTVARPTVRVFRSALRYSAELRNWPKFASVRLASENGLPFSRKLFKTTRDRGETVKNTRMSRDK